MLAIFRGSLLRQVWRGIKLCLLVLLVQAAWCTWLVYSYSTRTASRRADAAVVLGAAAWGKNPSPVFRERINHGITLYRSNRVGKLIFTGGTPKAGYMTEAEVARRYARGHGVPNKDILLETTSRDTQQNLENTKALMYNNGLESVVIISDPYHLARALEIASDLDIEAYISATPTTRFDQSKEKNKFLLQESYALFLYRIGKWSENFWDWLTVRETKEEA